MPSTSHARCKVCRIPIHARQRFGLCPQHSRIHYERLSAERRQAKLRKAARSAQEIERLTSVQEPLEEEQPMAENIAAAVEAEIPEYRQRVNDRIKMMSAERKLEIATHYDNHTIPTGAIQKAYGISGTILAAIADEVGVARRPRGNTNKALTSGTWHIVDGKRTWVPTNTTVPEAQQRALENMLRLPAKPEPVAPTPAIERRGLQPKPEPQHLPLFTVTVAGTFTVAATDIMAAMQRCIHDYPNLRITAISEAEPAS